MLPKSAIVNDPLGGFFEVFTRLEQNKGLEKSSTTTLGNTFIKNDLIKEAIEDLDKDDCDENIGLEGLDEFSLSDIPEIPSPELELQNERSITPYPLNTPSSLTSSLARITCFL